MDRRWTFVYALYGTVIFALYGHTSGQQAGCSVSPTDNVAFDSSNYTFTHPYNSSPSTGVGNMTLFIRQQYITDNLGNVSSLNLSLVFSSGNGILLVDGLMTLERGYSLDNDAVLEIGREGRQWRPNSGSFVITSADYSICSSGNTSYWSIPVEFLLTKGPRTVGTRRWVVELSSIANSITEVDLFNFTSPRIEVVTNPIEGCGPDQHFIFSSSSCVSSCPCGTKPFPYFCLEGLQGFLNQTVITTLNVSSNSTNGTIYTYYLLFDPNLYFHNDQSKVTMVFITVQYVGIKMEGTDQLMRTHELIFEPFVSIPGTSFTQTDSSLVIHRLRSILSSGAMLENCSYSNGSYDILPIQVRLVSPSLYQLGEHVILVTVELVPTMMPAINILGQLQLVVQPDTTCTNVSKQLFNLVEQECVSECSCGDVAFRTTSTPYCESGISVSRPAWLSETQLKLAVDVGNSTTAIVRVYFRPMFQIHVPGMFGFPDQVMVNTDNVTMLLRTEQVSSSVQDIDHSNDTLLVRLQIGDELQENLTVSLNSLFLQNRGLQNCTPQANSGELISYIPLTVVLDNVLVSGQYRFAVVAEFSSTNVMIESDLRDPDRFINVTQVLRVDIVATMPTTITSTSSTLVAPTTSSRGPTLTSVSRSTTTRAPSSTPVPRSNEIIMTLEHLTTANFTEVEQKFRETVAESVNAYCQGNRDMCRIVERKRQDISVQADDVIVTSTMDSGNGLQVHLYVQHLGGVIPQQALVAAIESSSSKFSAAGFTVVDVMVAVQDGLSTGVIIGIVVGGIAVIAVIVLIVLITIILAVKSNVGSDQGNTSSDQLDKSVNAGSNIQMQGRS